MKMPVLRFYLQSHALTRQSKIPQCANEDDVTDTFQNTGRG